MGEVSTVWKIHPHHSVAIPAKLRDAEPKLPKPVLKDRPTFKESKQKAIDDFEREYLLDLLQETGGNLSEAARRVGAERRTLTRMLRRHGINRTSA